MKDEHLKLIADSAVDLVAVYKGFPEVPAPKKRWFGGYDMEALEASMAMMVEQYIDIGREIERLDRLIKRVRKEEADGSQGSD